MSVQTIPFHGSPYPTIGVEVELQLLDAATGDLSNTCDQLLAEIPAGWGPTFKPELFQSNLEINTGICRTVAEAERDLREKLTLLHGMLVECMKAKQTTDLAHVENLRSMLAEFRTAYFAK